LIIAIFADSCPPLRHAAITPLRLPPMIFFHCFLPPSLPLFFFHEDIFVFD
jgi:hypothetical protein